MFSLSRSAWLKAVMEIGTTCSSSWRLRAVTTTFSRPATTVSGVVSLVCGVASAWAKAWLAPPSALQANRAAIKRLSMKFPLTISGDLWQAGHFCIAADDSEALKESRGQIKPGRGCLVLPLKPYGIYGLHLAAAAGFRGGKQYEQNRNDHRRGQRRGAGRGPGIGGARLAVGAGRPQTGYAGG